VKGRLARIAPLAATYALEPLAGVRANAGDLTATFDFAQ